MQYIRRKIVVALGCVLIVVGAACGGTQQPTPAPTIDIEATVEARFQKKLAEDAALEAKAEAMAKVIVEATARAAPTFTPIPTATPLPTPTATATPVPTTTPSPTATLLTPPTTTALKRIPDLIPRTVLFDLPNKSNVLLSPDGTRISYRAPLCGPVWCVMNIWVAPVDDPSAAEPVTHETTTGIRNYFWAFTSNHILYTQDTDGDENWRVYSVDLTTNQTTGLTPPEGVQARIHGGSPNFQTEIMVELNDRDPESHDLYRINILNGERNLIQRNEGFFEFITDHDYKVRLATRFTSDGGSEILRPTIGGEWQTFAKIEMEDSLTTFPMWINETGEVIYMADSRKRDTSALIAVNLGTSDRTVIAEDHRADFNDVIVHPTGKYPQAVAFTYDRKHWQIVDNSIGSDLEYLRGVLDSDFEVVSQSLDNKQWIVTYLTDNGPERYYYFDREQRNARFLFTGQAGLEAVPLARMHPVIIKARDGLALVSYLTLPTWTDSDGDAFPDEPLPMVFVVHGGPWSRDEWGYNSEHQLLANRGYAVLSVNFRGSTGFGKNFINAANREYAGKMHQDLIDAVNWAIEGQIANPNLIAIMGSSYGGYATLVGLTFTPDVFACGVEFAGPSNLITDLESMPVYWAPAVEMFATRVGDHRTEEGRAFLRERSPLTYVDRIKRPLLIGQGANDPRVKQSESDQIVQAMQRKRIPVTYVIYPDEGHGFSSANNARSFYAFVEAFLSECIGGRYEPIGNDFDSKSINVRVGAELIPGLSEALSADTPTQDDLR